MEGLGCSCWLKQVNKGVLKRIKVLSLDQARMLFRAYEELWEGGTWAEEECDPNNLECIFPS